MRTLLWTHGPPRAFNSCIQCTRLWTHGPPRTFNRCIECKHVGVLGLVASCLFFRRVILFISGSFCVTATRPARADARQLWESNGYHRWQLRDLAHTCWRYWAYSPRNNWQGGSYTAIQAHHLLQYWGHLASIAHLYYTRPQKHLPSRYSRRIILPQRRCSLCRLCELHRC